jgi:hypothetical protein
VRPGTRRPGRQGYPQESRLHLWKCGFNLWSIGAFLWISRGFRKETRKNPRKPGKSLARSLPDSIEISYALPPGGAGSAGDEGSYGGATRRSGRVTAAGAGGAGRSTGSVTVLRSQEGPRNSYLRGPFAFPGRGARTVWKGSGTASGPPLLRPDAVDRPVTGTMTPCCSVSCRP